MMRRAFPILLLLPLAVSCLACGGGGPSVSTVRWEIERLVPEARFEPEVHLRFGRLTLGLARHIVHWADPGDPDVAPLDHVRRVEVATYRVHALPDLAARLAGQTRFARALAASGWTMNVAAREARSRTWVFTRGDASGALSNLYVVALERDELTLVRIDGRLDRLVADSVAGHPGDFVRTMGGR